MADVSPIVDGVVNPAPLLQEAVEPVAVSLEPAAVPPASAAVPPAPAAEPAEAAASAAVVPEDTAAIVTVSPVVKANAAREAFSTGDAEASRAMHESTRVAHDGAVAKADEAHGGFGSDYVKSIVFGGLDGIITTFSTIASSVGGNLSIEAVITLGFANLIADAISMGVGDFISSKAEYDYLMAERAREEWEFDNHPEGEKQEMVDLLKSKGIDEEDATRVIDIVAKEEHKDFFVDYMMTEELGLEIPDDPWGPLKDGSVTFLSFCVFGAIPLIVYLICWGAKWENHGGIFGVACAATAVTLYALGALQGKITRLSTVRNGIFMAINGSLAAAAAYLVGWGLMKAVGNSC